MKVFMSTFFSMLILKFMTAWNKIKLIFNPAWWKSTGLAAITKFFRKLFNVKPRDKNDYYSMGRWLVSKKLAYAIVIGLAAISIFYIAAMSPLASALSSGGGPSVPTYKYNALPLKYYKGKVRIIAKDKHLAYEGFVKGGRADGQGKLYDKSDAMIYDGMFKDSMYEGYGTLFYPDGTVKYDGDFSKNQFHGAGYFFRPSGMLEYKGGYAFGLRSGRGELYNAGGNKVYTGTWSMDHMIYAELVAKTAAEAAEMYIGQATTYTVGDEYCAALHEIGALYGVRSGENTLDQEWRITSVYVLADSMFYNGIVIDTVDGLKKRMDKPEYAGFTWVNLADAVALNLCKSDEFEPIPVWGQFVLDEVYVGTGYDSNRQMYIYVYKMDGLVYTFYCSSASAKNFVMYSIEQE